MKIRLPGLHWEGSRVKSLATAVLLVLAAAHVQPALMAQTPVPVIEKLKPASGPVGTNVKIKGSNFGTSPASGSVTFNGTVASPTNSESDKIQVRVPEGATTGPVVMTRASSRTGRAGPTWPWSTPEKSTTARVSSPSTSTTGIGACRSGRLPASPSRPGDGARSTASCATMPRKPPRAMSVSARSPATIPSWPTGSSTTAAAPGNAAETAPISRRGSRAACLTNGGKRRLSIHQGARKTTKGHERRVGDVAKSWGRC